MVTNSFYLSQPDITGREKPLEKRHDGASELDIQVILFKIIWTASGGRVRMDFHVAKLMHTDLLEEGFQRTTAGLKRL